MATKALTESNFQETVKSGIVLVVTHDQRALDVFDSLYDMEDGQIAAQPVSAQVSPGSEAVL
jgi:hypothetical protein